MATLGLEGMPIAIIGMSCRFAGDATNPEKLWKVISEGRNTWTDIPSSRFDLKGVYDENPERLSTTHVRGAHFLTEDIALFDAAFFNMSTETAATLDPQYRLQLESVYEAIENAGIPLNKIMGSNTSVFAGSFFHDYHDGILKDTDAQPRLLNLGVGSAMAANRVSYYFDLHGPSMTIDTGCSTTLTALHQACQTLKSGDAEMAIVGGSNVMLNPDVFKTMSSLGLLGADGKSYAFDSRAEGYGRGEGVATVIIKPLAKALEDGDAIRAVIRETMLNQDGRTETITTPSQAAQENLIRACYERAGLSPLDTQYFEAHGTGTKTGDRIETRAIADVFKHGRDTTNTLCLGSIKTNIGHTEPASGLASIIKVVLAFEKGFIPPSTNFEEANVDIPLKEWRLKVPTELEPWPASASGVRRASVSNFGYGGSNAHVILESFQDYRSMRTEKLPNSHPTGRVESKTNGVNGSINGFQGGKSNGCRENRHHLGNGDVQRQPRQSSHLKVNGDTIEPLSKIFVLSGKDEQACIMIANHLRDHLQERKEMNDVHFLNDLAYTLGQRRTLFPWTTTCAATSVESLMESLDPSRLKPARTTDSPGIALVFTGQGAQWHAMGRELIEAYPVFRRSIEEADNYVGELGADWSLMEELLRDAKESRVSDISLSTPLCVAVQISLVCLLRSWGVTPVAVTSHSSGEVAAAYTVGVLSYRSAMAVSYFRSSATGGDTSAVVKTNGSVRTGGMLAVGLGREAVQPRLDVLTGGKVVVACVNSLSSTTVSGDMAAIDELESALKADEIFVRRLMVDAAYHSHHMEKNAEPYLAFLRGVKLYKEDSNFLDSILYSSPTTGEQMTCADEIASPEHWVRSMVQPTLFLDSFKTMILAKGKTKQSKVDIIIEVGPHAALSGPIHEILSLPEMKDRGLLYLSCLLRKQSAVDTMHTVAAELIRKGVPVDVGAVNFPLGRRRLAVLRDLPPYPWTHRTRHWTESRINKAYRNRRQTPHPLLGLLVPGCNPDAPMWSNVVRVAETPWLRDHSVQGNMVYPGAGYICLAIEAIHQINKVHEKNISGYQLRRVDILQALIVPDTTGGIEVQTHLRPADAKAIGSVGWHEFQVLSVTEDSNWTIHSKGLVSVTFEGNGSAAVTVAPPYKADYKQTYARHINPADVYDGMQLVGIKHGPSFQNIKAIRKDKSRSISTIAVADVPRREARVLHPTTLDSIFQAAYTALPEAGSSSESVARIPRSIKSIWVSQNLESERDHLFHAHSSITRCDSRSFQAAVSLVDASFQDGNGEDSTSPLVALHVDELVCQSLGGLLPDMRNHPNKDICATVSWAPDVTMMEPALLKAQLSSAIDLAEADMLSDLRRACIYYISDALAALTDQDVRSLEGHYKKLYEWMQSKCELAEAGKLGPDSEHWLKDTVDDQQNMLRRVEAASVNGKMVCRLGKNLVSMLRYEQVPLELMMEDKLLYTYYAEALKWDRSMQQMSGVLRHLIHKNPCMKILEIGAGTGGATRHALRVLGTADCGGPLAAEYHFTDISAGFFEEARKSFSEWSNLLTYHKLDIEVDPAKQGVACEAFDLIIACQVLHATASMDATMSNVRKLLKPGGRLLLVETTRDELDLQFVFGLLPGWWLSKEPERHDSPSLTISHWDRVLKATGFSGVDLEVHDCDSDELYSFSTIMSVAVTEALDSQYPELVLVIGKIAPPETWVEGLRKAIAGATREAKPAVESLETVNSANKVCIFLGEIENPFLHNADHSQLEAIKRLATNCKGLLWVSGGAAVNCERPEAALSTGLLRTLRQEYFGRTYISIDIDPSGPLLSEKSMFAIASLYASRFQNSGSQDGSCEFEFAERDGTILIPRVRKDITRNRSVSTDDHDRFTPVMAQLHQPNRPLKMYVGTVGELGSLYFDDDPLASHGLAPEVIEVEPKAFGVNFRDVMAILGQLDEQTTGFECAGIVTRVGTSAVAEGYAVGDHVMCAMRGNYGTRVRLPWTSAIHMPPELTFELAASIPIVFLTAYVSLFDTAGLQQGQSVLIHAATGGVGQAAIILAQSVGAEIFATASSLKKKQFLVERYGLPVDHIFCSRDASFSAQLLKMTAGNGVDVVLNSLAGPLLQESFNCLAAFGHFVEIGKRDLEQNNYLELGTFARTASFTSIDLLALAQHRGRHHFQAFSEIARMLTAKKIRPVEPVTVFPLTDIEKALRLMQAGKHMGKIVLSVAQDELVLARPLVPTVKLRSDASYLIVGGAGGIGQSIAHWMVEHGARNIIIMSRSAGVKDKIGAVIAELKTAGCRAVGIGCDVANSFSLAHALRQAEKESFPAIRGVVQGAMMLQDSIFEHMTIGDWYTCVRPKVQGSWNLHQQLLENQLDFFVMLSSVFGLVGYASQSNYSAGGSFQDALARYRVSRGLPGVSLDLGIIKSVGYVAQNQDIIKRLSKAGPMMVEEQQLLAVLGSAILDPWTPQVAVGLNTNPGPEWDESPLARDRRFASLRRQDDKGKAAKVVANSVDNPDRVFISKLTAASSLAEAEELISIEISYKLADIFMLPAEEFLPTKGPAAYGVDSLVAVEIRTMLASRTGADISIFQIMQSTSLLALAGVVASKSSYINRQAIDGGK